MTFGERLAAAVAVHGPLCVGIDPHPGLLARWGLADDPDGLERFAQACVTALAGHVAVVKPQSAFFERHGSRGVAVLERVLAALAGTGTLALLDVKRGDIGSTMDGYADAHLRPGAPLGADAVTLSPYLGFGSLSGAVRTAREAGRGVFVLARTSNPEGADVQLARRDGPDGVARTVAQGIVDAAAAANRDALAATRPRTRPAHPHGGPAAARPGRCVRAGRVRPRCGPGARSGRRGRRGHGRPRARPVGPLGGRAGARARGAGRHAGRSRGPVRRGARRRAPRGVPVGAGGRPRPRRGARRGRRPARRAGRGPGPLTHPPPGGRRPHGPVGHVTGCRRPAGCYHHGGPLRRPRRLCG